MWDYKFSCICCLSKEERKAIAKNKEINLILGTADSGKSTFIKQMRIIHGSGYSEDQRRGYTHLVVQNLLEAVRAMTNTMRTLEISYSNPQNERIAAEDYIPTQQDILRVRLPTTGINEYQFSIQKIILSIVDVGGQRSERRRWIHCFENMTSVIFVASLSEYDQVLLEHSMMNRMEKSSALFNVVIHMPWFANSSFILFLNKMDILAEKIQISDLKTYFPQFEGKQGDVHDAMLFIRKLYIQKADSYQEKYSKSIYCHFMCATDTTETRKLFSDMKDFAISGGLNEYKML